VSATVALSACATTSAAEPPNTLDRYEVGVWPSPIKLARALSRPDEPFVMVNLLAFKERATGDYAHLSGREAYDIYAESVGKVQGPMGSRLLWAGDIRSQLEGTSDPPFEVAALLQYASPGAFISFATKGESENAARSAGLRGQWLLACTTLASSPPPAHEAEHVVLVELRGFVDESGERSLPWRRAWVRAVRDAGGRPLWRGRVDQQVIGVASPAIDEVVVTWFPSQAALDEALLAPAVVAEGESLRRGLWPWWTYSARSLDLLPQLRGERSP
jgi:uncharacterized protein (DUF1330 family)